MSGARFRAEVGAAAVEAPIYVVDEVGNLRVLTLPEYAALSFEELARLDIRISRISAEALAASRKGKS